MEDGQVGKDNPQGENQEFDDVECWQNLEALLDTIQQAALADSDEEKLEINVLDQLFLSVDYKFFSSLGRMYWYDCKKAYETMINRLEALNEPPVLVGSSPAMQKLREEIGKIGPTNATVLMTAETGTGKNLLARLIHHTSDRRAKHFGVTECGSIPCELLESELFGHTKGAFTGATRDKDGRFAQVNGGTILLDEIGDMDHGLQVKILGVLQERKVRRLGADRDTEVDVRVIAATNQDLERAVRDGRFRRDLYYRLNVVNITVPPLRERKEDIPELATHLIQRFAKEYDKEIHRELPADVIRLLKSHFWPGNVRELENILQRAIIRAEGGTLTMRDFGGFDRVIKDSWKLSPQQGLLAWLRDFKRRHLA